MDDFHNLPMRDYPARRGASPTALRQHNERTILTMLRDRGSLASAQIAQELNLSAQTASNIVRALERQGLLTKLPPVKGKVGKPQTPLALNPRGALSYGLRIGRRSADLVLIDFLGRVQARWTRRYRFPTPEGIEAFCRGVLVEDAPQAARGAGAPVAGLGIAAPFELWNWLDQLGVPQAKADAWRNYRFEVGFAAFTDLPILVANDVNLACTGELMFGNGRQVHDFLYFYIAAFVGGAIVFGGRVFHGRYGNAGAFGSMLFGPADAPDTQMIGSASMIGFERAVAAGRGTPVHSRIEPAAWDEERALAGDWMDGAASALARACVSLVAALDIADIVIDGMFPAHIRTELVARVRDRCAALERRGIREPAIVEGRLGADAGPLGAAYQPLLATHFVEGSALSA